MDMTTLRLNNILLAIFILTIPPTLISCSDNNSTGPTYNPEIEFVDGDLELPQPIGGYSTFQANLRYPDAALEYQIEGLVVINTLIDKNGIVKESIPLTNLGYGTEEEAIIAIELPPWIPALRRGRPVDAWVSFPVQFSLY